LIDAAPAAGKSFMIAAISDALHEISGGKKVLNLAPSKELVVQNHEKMLMTGHPASIFSASAGIKSTRHNIVFGTPKTVSNSISRFLNGYCAVNIDEAHGITDTIRHIIDSMREYNPNLRVIGWSGTPFRMNTGYIYRIGVDGKPVPEEQAVDPYFLKCIHKVSAKEMLEQGYICPMDVGSVKEGYDATELKPNRMGKFDPKDLHSVFVGKGRLTASVVADIVDHARHRFGGCMIFASTVEHMHEIMESLPPANSGYVSSGDASAVGGTIRGRDAVLKAYRAQQFKYIVSVGTLTTGVDVDHTSVIATARKTESASLLEQILGRAWRTHPDKKRALWLDYTGQVDEHFPDGDIYNPKINARPVKQGGGIVNASCPTCSTVNEFSSRPNPDEFPIDKEGYFVDLAGNRIETEHGAMPAHYGRRCLGGSIVTGKWAQCSYRWTCKTCEACGDDNDIAARYCGSCKAELVDPNAKLDISFRKLKKDPYQPQSDEVLKWEVKETISQAGKETYRIDATTPYRSFSVWISKEPKHPQALHQLEMYLGLGGEPPNSVKYIKETNGFFRIIGFNTPIDINEADQELFTP
jgi:DNA repair protein RadD